MDDSTTGVTERAGVTQSGAKIWTLFFGGFDTTCRLPYYPFTCRGVAQPGRALGSGPRGRRFESSRPDQSNQTLTAASIGGRISFVANLLDGSVGCRHAARSNRAPVRQQ